MAEYPDDAFDPVLLVSIADKAELGMAQELLARAEIPYFEKTRKSGEYLKIATGMTLLGTELYVAQRDVSRAIDALSVLGLGQNDGADAEVYEPDVTVCEEAVARKDGGSYKSFFWFLGAFGVFLLVLAAIRLFA